MWCGPPRPKEFSQSRIRRRMSVLLTLSGIFASRSSASSNGKSDCGNHILRSLGPIPHSGVCPGQPAECLPRLIPLSLESFGTKVFGVVLSVLCGQESLQSFDLAERITKPVHTICPMSRTGHPPTSGIAAVTTVYGRVVIHLSSPRSSDHRRIGPSNFSAASMHAAPSEDAHKPDPQFSTDAT